MGDKHTTGAPVTMKCILLAYHPCGWSLKREVTSFLSLPDDSHPGVPADLLNLAFFVGR